MVRRRCMIWWLGKGVWQGNSWSPLVRGTEPEFEVAEPGLFWGVDQRSLNECELEVRAEWRARKVRCG
jgi:hypothetical protein